MRQTNQQVGIDIHTRYWYVTVCWYVPICAGMFADNYVYTCNSGGIVFCFIHAQILMCAFAQVWHIVRLPSLTNIFCRHLATYGKQWQAVASSLFRAKAKCWSWPTPISVPWVILPPCSLDAFLGGLQWVLCKICMPMSTCMIMYSQGIRRSLCNLLPK